MRFVDSSFWIALLVPRDRHHQEARALWLTDLDPILSTSHVMGETWTFLRRRAGHAVAVGFLDAILDSPRLIVVRASAETEAEAWDWLRRHDEREYSFVDAVSFASMRRRRMTDALAFDGDFSAAGFVEIRSR